MTVRTYATPAAFKQALEERLRKGMKAGVELGRNRQLLVFARFLARIVIVFGDAAILKGGLVLEMRLARARTTLVGEPDRVVAKDVLAFAGIAPPTLQLYPVESHIAEKLHAYTLPRSRPNTRVKDLPDLGLLATIRSLDGRRLREALVPTFEFHNTHSLPTKVPNPPKEWTKAYATMAR